VGYFIVKAWLIQISPEITITCYLVQSVGARKPNNAVGRRRIEPMAVRMAADGSHDDILTLVQDTWCLTSNFTEGRNIKK
jgi:hypothetical protein